MDTGICARPLEGASASQGSLAATMTSRNGNLNLPVVLRKARARVRQSMR